MKFSFLAIIVLVCFHSHAQNYLDYEAKEIQVQKMPSDTSKVVDLIKLSREIENTNPHKAILLGKQALALSQQLKYFEGVSGSFNCIGRGYRLSGDFDSALFYFHKSLHYQKQIGKQIDASALSNIGVVFKNMGIYDSATIYYHRALKIAEDANDKDIQANVLNNLGNVLKDQDNLEEAIENYLKALEIRIQQKNRRGIANTMLNLGIIYDIRHEYTLSEKYFKDALGSYSLLDDKSGMVKSMNNITQSLISQHKNAEALPFLHEALKLEEQLGDKLSKASTLFSIANLTNKIKKFHEAIKLSKQSLQLAIEIGNKQLELDNYNLLEEISLNIDDYKEAHNYLQKAYALKDSLSNENKSRIINELLTKFEFEKKERQIAILHLENKINIANLIYFFSLTYLKNESPLIFAIVLIALIYLLGLILTYFISFFTPLLLIRMVDAIDTKTQVTGHYLGLNITFSLNTILPIRPVAYSRRNIRKWIDKFQSKFIDKFNSSIGIENLQLYLPTPLTINNNYFEYEIEYQIEQTLRMEIAKYQTIINIVGEGGIGKSTIGVFLINKLCNKNSLISNFKLNAIPIFIGNGIWVEENLDIVNCIRIMINRTSETKYSKIFIKFLLRKKKIILFIDSLSEITKLNNSMSLLEIIENVNFLVTSSRINYFEDMPCTLIEPKRLKGQFIPQFVNNYVLKKGHRLDDKSLFNLCHILSGAHENKEVTILFTTMFTDIYLSNPDDISIATSLPRATICYIYYLNNKIAQNEKIPNEKVLIWCKRIAWLEMKKDFNPKFTDITEINFTIDSTYSLDDILNYLKAKVSILAIGDEAGTLFKFTNDSIAEYLCSYYILEEWHQKNLQPFNYFKSYLELNKVDNINFLKIFKEVENNIGYENIQRNQFIETFIEPFLNR